MSQALVLGWIRSIAGAFASVTVKVVVTDITSTKLLELPAELNARGWVFSIVAALIGAAVAATFAPDVDDPQRSRTCLLNSALCCGGALLCLVGFFAVDFGWKRLPTEAFDFMYHWLEPLLFATVFGFLSAAITHVLGIPLPPNSAKSESSET
jgi:hypothetical protein